MQSKVKVLVLGATGGVGGEMMSALLAAGYEVKALSRNAQTPRAGVTWIKGDVMDRETVRKAAESVQFIFHGVNPPKYQNWETLVIPMIENTIYAAEKVGARIILPGTIYNYGEGTAQPITEDSPQRPSTKKGRVRVELESKLLEASQRGVRVLIVRAGDFFGPNKGSSWFSQAFVKPGLKVKSITNPGTKGKGHAWAYLPDLAATIVRVMDREADLSAFELFHFGGHWDKDGTEMAKAIQRAVGGDRVKIKGFPWFALPFIAPFSAVMREILEVRYLWKGEYRLDNAKLQKFLGEEKHTDLDIAVRETLKGLGCV
ncbi:MAG: NAD-dependent epimerase/dehydratase family protein [Proteobacteria bacterium]|nr:MAG: NAD-dependent epimerase/dehydratase family protein [Pseudomonadota bacterium]